MATIVAQDGEDESSARIGQPISQPALPKSPLNKDSSTVKSDAVLCGKRPMFAVGRAEAGADSSEDEDEAEEADGRGSCEVLRKSGRVSPAASFPNRRPELTTQTSVPLPETPKGAAQRKTTVVYQQPLSVVPMSEDNSAASSPGAPPAQRANRFFSDSQVPTTKSTRHSAHGNHPLVFRKSIVDRWKRVVARAVSQDDPWKKHGIASLPVLSCLRHRYSSIRKAWVVDRVEVKMEGESFAHGAMRKCFRLKKLSTGRSYRHNDWAHALNYVAKSYIEPVSKETYFEDVKLQMDAKLWAEEYNRHRPPKKVDIFQISILEFEDGQMESPFYHLEHFIEGEYKKYNSNSGFVDEVGRMTPQAFSHFTFERSGHQQIVVDVQGVGDLYTDPQIHTLHGAEYGDGNLGSKGMALFFQSHICNDICSSMGLTPFDLAPSEVAERKKRLSSLRPSAHSQTVCRGMSKLVESPDIQDQPNGIIDFLRLRAVSERISEAGSSSEDGTQMSPHSPRSQHSPRSDGLSSMASAAEDAAEPPAVPPPHDELVRACPPAAGRRRQRMDSELDASLYSGDCGSGASSVKGEQHEREAYWMEMRKKSRPAAVMGLEGDTLDHLHKLAAFRDAESAKRQEESAVLGQIHLDMARYHELGRFVEAGTEGEAKGQAFDKAAAWYHLDMAAKCSVPLALMTCARIYLGLPHDDLLGEFALEASDDEERAEFEDRALEYMSEAAEGGDKDAALFLADAFTSGTTLGSEHHKSFADAAHWLDKALQLSKDDEPVFQIKASLAELYAEGGFGLDADPMKAGDLFNEAAEGAMEAGKGKLSTQLYAKSEEAWANVPEDQEATEE